MKSYGVLKKKTILPSKPIFWHGKTARKYCTSEAELVTSQSTCHGPYRTSCEQRSLKFSHHLSEGSAISAAKRWVERWSPLHWSYSFFQTKSLVLFLTFLDLDTPGSPPIHQFTTEFKISKSWSHFFPPRQKHLPQTWQLCHGVEVRRNGGRCTLVSGLRRGRLSHPLEKYMDHFPRGSKRKNVCETTTWRYLN